MLPNPLGRYPGSGNNIAVVPECESVRAAIGSAHPLSPDLNGANVLVNILTTVEGPVKHLFPDVAPEF